MRTLSILKFSKPPPRQPRPIPTPFQDLVVTLRQRSARELYSIILLATMNRGWMLGTLVFGSFIALGRNIHIAMEYETNSDFSFFTVPFNEKPKLRRILSDNLYPSHSFIFFDEEAMSRERSLYRARDKEIVVAMEDLLGRASAVLESAIVPVRSHAHAHLNSQPQQVTAVQQNTTLLGLAYFLTGYSDYAEQAVQMIRYYFISPMTQMTHAALYNSNSHGQLYQLLDAIQMVQGYLDDSEIPQLHEWFTTYLEYFEQDDLSKSTNHTGLYYDIEDMAVSHFVGDEARQAQIWKRSLERLEQQIDEKDKLPQEMTEGSCEHYQMYTLQGWWTLARLFANAMGESLWTAEREALCRASASAIPYLTQRDKCSVNEPTDDSRWWPIVVDTLRHCPQYQAKNLHWRDWMTPESKEVPANLYAMPRIYAPDTGIAPYWNFGMPTKKSENTHSASSSFTTVLPKGLHIPAKLAKAAETDAEMELRVSRITRWYALGQTEIAERMMKKALKDLRGTKIVWQPKDIIPEAMLDAAKEDRIMSERVSRIRRWHGLKQTTIVERMIQKTMDEMAQLAADDAAVQALTKQTADIAADRSSSFLRSQADIKPGKPVEVKTKERSSLMEKILSSSKTPSKFIAPFTTEGLELPPSLIRQAQNDVGMTKRIHRIQRWKHLGQHDVADRMIQKLMASTEDQLF